MMYQPFVVHQIDIKLLRLPIPQNLHLGTLAAVFLRYQITEPDSFTVPEGNFISMHTHIHIYISTCPPTIRSSRNLKLHVQTSCPPPPTEFGTTSSSLARDPYRCRRLQYLCHRNSSGCLKLATVRMQVQWAPRVVCEHHSWCSSFPAPSEDQGFPFFAIRYPKSETLQCSHHIHRMIIHPHRVLTRSKHHRLLQPRHETQEPGCNNADI